MESVAEEEKASSPAAAAAGRSTTTTGAVEGSLLSCLPSLAEETVAEDDDDDGDGDAAVAEEQSPAVLPTSSLSLAAGSAAVAPGRRRLPIVPAQVASVSQDTRDKASVFSNIPPRPSREPASSKYSELAWQQHFDEEKQITIPDSADTFHVYLAGTQGPVLFCLHGGGYTGLSFALVAGKMKEKVRIVAMDARGHGLSSTEDDSDLSAEMQCQDVLNVIKAMYGHETPAIILVGHSMGGAIAVRVAAKRALPTLAGLVVVDVVEGTAMASLVHMQRILSNRQLHFPSVEKAIEWSVRGGGALRNVDSARVSVPSTLRYQEDKHCYVWRTRLEDSETHWRGWYEGLSEVFLSCPVPKLLLLAGTDRLDRNLTIGQMQGKFQMIVIRHTGHAIQEDEPDEFANVLLNFISRNRIGSHGVEIPGIRRPITLRSAN
ncbi:hypothetical protein CY35_01G057800 [Sphagnum magellanicum]|nr:hypothetical protein CY35_01G057800 [Sphagnum magellanicum]